MRSHSPFLEYSSHLSIFDAQSFIAPRETLTETQTAKPNPIGPKARTNERTAALQRTNKQPAADSDLIIGQRNASGSGWADCGTQHRLKATAVCNMDGCAALRNCHVACVTRCHGLSHVAIIGLSCLTSQPAPPAGNFPNDKPTSHGSAGLSPAVQYSTVRTLH